MWRYLTHVTCNPAGLEGPDRVFGLAASRNLIDRRFRQLHFREPLLRVFDHRQLVAAIQIRAPRELQSIGYHTTGDRRRDLGVLELLLAVRQDRKSTRLNSSH